MKRRIRHILLGGVLLAGIGGCQSPDQTAATDVNPAGWEQTAEIRMENADTVTLRDAALFVRYDERFAEDTLTVRIAAIAPDSLRFEEAFLLAIPRTKSPAPLTGEALIPYRHRIRLVRAGEYRWCITPVRSVRGVEAVGIRLSKSH
ncbi:MAG TPA: hypothetical protein H9828_05310 [Candidatus Alistipes intestinigallinarum]|uniref:Lipoprotein n=1 Tax=Candidatus Alistipes intestinigallinarum TaxID=2838440 RepID=A0A9D1YZK4_9BACT|nr:hypothetical protein [Candidatus Alistipes intestinigallinarum]